MARKDPAQWTDAYRRRIERAQAKGLSRQQARGHTAREHVARRERERREAVNLGKLTTEQRAAVRKFAKQQALKIRSDPLDPKSPPADWQSVYGPMHDWTQRNGFNAFRALKDRQRAMSRDYRSEMRRGVYASRKEDFLSDWSGYDFENDEDLDFDFDADPPDPRWLYYH